MNRIDFETPGPIERSERIHEAERARGENRRQRPDRRNPRRKKRKPAAEEAESEREGARKKLGTKLDIEA